MDILSVYKKVDTLSVNERNSVYPSVNKINIVYPSVYKKNSVYPSVNKRNIVYLSVYKRNSVYPSVCQQDSHWKIHFTFFTKSEQFLGNLCAVSSPIIHQPPPPHNTSQLLMH